MYYSLYSDYCRGCGNYSNNLQSLSPITGNVSAVKCEHFSLYGGPRPVNIERTNTLILVFVLSLKPLCKMLGNVGDGGRQFPGGRGAGGGTGRPAGFCRPDCGAA